jgi:hypothetical protein
LRTFGAYRQLFAFKDALGITPRGCELHQRIATMPGPGPAQGIAYAPDHTMVAVAYANAVLLWDVASPAAPHRIRWSS